MATIPRTYLITNKEGLNHLQPENGQVISLYDTDGLYYVAPDNGTTTGNPVLRQVSGVKVVSGKPQSGIEDIIYVDTTDNTSWIWLNNSWTPIGNYTTDTKVTTTTSNSRYYLAGSSLSSTATGTLLKNANVYAENGVIYADLDGNATSATSATSATKDGSNNTITAKYYADVAFNTSNRKLTMTCGDGSTTKQVTIPDTTYSVFSSSANGLTPKTSTVVVSDSTNLILTGSGWLNKDNVSVGSATNATNATNATSATTATSATSATSATKDGSNNTITSTYIASASYSDNSHAFTFTKGNGTSSTTATIPQFSQSNMGLVPAASTAGATDKFLKGDGTWSTLTVANYQGADASTAGTAGLVPPASAGQQNYYLKGSGTWGTTFAEGSAGLVPAPTSSDSGKFLMGNGTWATPTSASNTTNTAGATNDTTNNLYLVGSRTQQSASSASDGLVTYTNQYIYVSGNRFYQSDGGATPSAVAVVDVSSTQALTNKTYEGYTLGNACAKTVATSVAQNANLPTNSAVITYVNGRISSVQTNIDAKASNSVIAPIYSSTDTYDVGDFCMYDDGNGAKLYQCNTTISTVEAWNSAHWNAKDSVMESKVNSSVTADKISHIVSLSNKSGGTSVSPVSAATFTTETYTSDATVSDILDWVDNNESVLLHFDNSTAADTFRVHITSAINTGSGIRPICYLYSDGIHKILALEVGGSTNQLTLTALTLS